MNLKRVLIENLPPTIKRWLAIPYDILQTRRADRKFASKSLTSRTPAQDAPDQVVVVVVDALRADHIDQETTPFLSSLNGTDAVTPGSWTFPAVSSILAGCHPHEHGAMRQSDEPDDSEGLTLPPRMAEERETLTEVLAGAGYDTYGGFGHDTPFVAVSGRFDTHALYHKVNSNADDVLDDYVDWAADREKAFGFLHLADPHIPVDPPASYWVEYDVDSSIGDIENWRFRNDIPCEDDCETYRTHRRQLYRASVDYVDDAVSRFVDRLDDQLGEYLLVVTSDHGEALWEHVETDVEHFDGTGCVDHGGAPYEELARVPFLTNVEWEFDERVSLVDLAPTLLDTVGVSGPDMSGYSILDGIPEDRRPIVEGSLSGHEKKGIYDDEYKLIVSKGDDVELGFEILDEGNPALREEPADIPDDRRDAMLEDLPPWPDGSDVETEVSDVVSDRLDQLGYT